MSSKIYSHLQSAASFLSLLLMPNQDTLGIQACVMGNIFNVPYHTTMAALQHFSILLFNNHYTPYVMRNHCCWDKKSASTAGSIENGAKQPYSNTACLHCCWAAPEVSETDGDDWNMNTMLFWHQIRSHKQNQQVGWIVQSTFGGNGIGTSTHLSVSCPSQNYVNWQGTSAIVPSE